MGSLATRRVSGWRTALQLGRVSNLPTVWSNVIAGSVACRNGAPALGDNPRCRDLGDVRRRHVPQRRVRQRYRCARAARTADPLRRHRHGRGVRPRRRPAHRRHRRHVRNQRPCRRCRRRAGRRHPALQLAPQRQSICAVRYGVVPGAGVCGRRAGGRAHAVGDSIDRGSGGPPRYVAGLTYTARLENLDRVASLWPLPLLAAPVIVALNATDFSAAAVIALAALAACGVRVAQLLRRRAQGDVGRAVGLLIAAISLNDALFATTTGVDYAPSLVSPASHSPSRCNAMSLRVDEPETPAP